MSTPALVWYLAPTVRVLLSALYGSPFEGPGDTLLPTIGGFLVSLPSGITPL